MSTVLNLCGNWSLQLLGDGEHTYNIAATVPGCAHTDLIRAGILPDLFWQKNNEVAGWVENCDAIYSRSFTLDTLTDGLYLCFKGLDTYCDVYLNGTLIGSADDMFIPWEFCADGALRVGENTLEVRFRSPIREVADCPPRHGAFTTERINTRRIQCTYGWDWVARFVTMGIWREVTLERRVPDRLEHVYVWTQSLNAYAAKVGIRAAFADVTGSKWVDFTITAPDNQTVFKKSRCVLTTDNYSTDTSLTELVDIADAKLWYPFGYGEQPLYTLTVSTGGEVIKKVEFGIRTVEILELEDADDSDEAKLSAKLKQTEHLSKWDRNDGSSGFILLINGVRIFCPGANYVPSEPFVSEESDKKLTRLVELAREGGYRMIRVWGGGIFAPEAFYSACDRLGVLATQDFLMACGSYPEDDDSFIEKLKLEAKAGALALRNHPSLVWWSGDNENAVSGDENKSAYNGRRAALEAIGPVLYEYDQSRRFLPSSPYGGVPYASGTRGTSHVTQYLEFLFKYYEKGDFSDYRAYFDTYLTRFCAEQPAMGMPYASAMTKFMTEADIFGDDTSVSEYHTQGNPALAHSLYWYIDRLATGIFGEYADGHDRVRKMQMLQCERVRLSLELYRRNAWYSSGIIYWMFNDCWPAANSWSHVDYYTAPKPAYYSFKRTAKPLIGALTERDGCLCAYISHIGEGSASGTGRIYVYDIATGAETWETACTFSVSNESVCAATIDMAELAPHLDRSAVVLFDITADIGSDRAYFLPHGYRDVPWESYSHTVIAEDSESLTVRADVTLPVLLLDVLYLLSDNSFFMKKGEVRRLEKLAGI